ncbi:MAG TPA: hypothetical protein VEU74_11940 [Gemmatimonadales bacterium]|nr:hypothetical protein [Gemmatimonadales bacterium]
MVHRSHGRGTFVLDRRFSRVLGAGARGRIQVASGTTDPKTFRTLNVMLDEFAERQPGLLEEIRDKRLAPLAAYRLWASGAWLRYTESQRHAGALVATLEAWAKKKGKLSARTTEARLAFVELVRGYAKAGATLAEMPALLERYREDCEDADTASAFNHTRSHARAFLRDTLKKSDRLYAAVVDVAPLPETPKVGRHPQTPEGARAIAAKLGPAAGAIWLSLCYTGMNLKEYYADGWEVDYELDAVRIHGKKRRDRERIVPLLAIPVQPQLKRQGFRSALRRAQVGVAPHDARRSYANWLAAAKIEANRRDYYRGHSPETMRQLYEQPDETIRKFLREDGRALRAYCNLGPPGLKVESA